MTSNVHHLKIADADRAIRHVFVRDLRLDASIGVYAHEKQNAQPVVINIDLTVQEGVTTSDDDIRNVVCYETVVNKVKAVLADGHIHLVETMAEAIAHRCLEDARVEVARVRVEKTAAIAEAASVGVEIERRRTGRTGPL
ncbi:dihydroneopterin aldolase [Futiania mangrovi]|uniref:7,8-dihydroneopterin aldolase n=1 Tax=Futiania mangrovi TaxID=2959716 RepID=A0A9J6PMZ0_9PROT|nr:dihydroneopterin aldolase [Futiania mangrovii]MCP1337434.1 dihydroneopterin aldolase [Futiania mangrovii]